jgi:hypothetical protein
MANCSRNCRLDRPMDTGDVRSHARPMDARPLQVPASVAHVNSVFALAPLFLPGMPSGRPCALAKTSARTRKHCNFSLSPPWTRESDNVLPPVSDVARALNVTSCAHCPIPWSRDPGSRTFQRTAASNVYGEEQDLTCRQRTCILCYNVVGRNIAETGRE